MALPFKKADEKPAAKTPPPADQKSPGSGPVPPPGQAAALDPATRKAVTEEAYRLWKQDGCKQGKDQYYWFEAEKRVKAAKK